MAKKTKSYSHIDVTRALENLAQTGTSASEFIFHLLRIFAGYGDGQIKRIKEGTGNSAKDGKTVLVKKLVAYRMASTSDEPVDCSMLYDVVRDMISDERIAKHSPRMYIASDGVKLVVYDPKSQQYEDSTVEWLWRGFEFLNPLAGIEKVPPTPEAEADVKSAELMAKLFDDIRRYNPFQSDEDIHLLNVFMSRLLFCFFAEDTGLFPGENLFTNTLKTYTTTGSDVKE
ncbi:MAG: hypothetical protein K2L01_02535, partial [Rikenellaceae bacterium]|nr:hypothetical protein [Rikenellaceae bacterium]